MKVKIELSEEYQPPYAVIYTNCVTESGKPSLTSVQERETLP